MPVNFVGMSPRVRYCILNTWALKLSFGFALHHVLNRDALVRVILLRLRHARFVPVQDTVVDGMRWISFVSRKAATYDAIARNSHHATLICMWLERFHGLIQIESAKTRPTRNHLRATASVIEPRQWLCLSFEAGSFEHWAHHLLISLNPAVLHQANLLRTRNCWVKSVHFHRCLCHINL